MPVVMDSSIKIKEKLLTIYITSFYSSEKCSVSQLMTLVVPYDKWIGSYHYTVLNQIVLFIKWLAIDLHHCKVKQN